MKVKIRKHKKSPAPVAEEQVKRLMDDKEIDYYCNQYELMKFPIDMLESVHIG